MARREAVVFAGLSGWRISKAKLTDSIKQQIGCDFDWNIKSEFLNVIHDWNSAPGFWVFLPVLNSKMPVDGFFKCPHFGFALKCTVASHFHVRVEKRLGELIPSVLSH